MCAIRSVAQRRLEGNMHPNKHQMPNNFVRTSVHNTTSYKEKHVCTPFVVPFLKVSLSHSRATRCDAT